MTNETYSADELIELGCPRELIIQYLWFSKEEINQMIYISEIENLIEAMT